MLACHFFYENSTFISIDCTSLYNAYTCVGIKICIKLFPNRYLLPISSVLVVLSGIGYLWITGVYVCVFVTVAASEQAKN